LRGLKFDKETILKNKSAIWSDQVPTDIGPLSSIRIIDESLINISNISPAKIVDVVPEYKIWRD